MACGNTYKSPRCKSCVRYFNNITQPIPVSTTLPLVIAGTRVVNTGVSIDAEPQSYTTHTNGLYHISADVSVAATAAGEVVLYWTMDGVQLPCTVTEQRIAIGNATIHTETDIDIRGCCCAADHTFALVIVSDDAATGTVTHVCSGIIKEA